MSLSSKKADSHPSNLDELIIKPHFMLLLELIEGSSVIFLIAILGGVIFGGLTCLITGIMAEIFLIWFFGWLIATTYCYYAYRKKKLIQTEYVINPLFVGVMCNNLCCTKVSFGIEQTITIKLRQNVYQKRARVGTIEIRAIPLGNNGKKGKVIKLRLENIPEPRKIYDLIVKYVNRHH